MQFQETQKKKPKNQCQNKLSKLNFYGTVKLLQGSFSAFEKWPTTPSFCV
jgi:hypothetical protein